MATRRQFEFLPTDSLVAKGILGFEVESIPDAPSRRHVYMTQAGLLTRGAAKLIQRSHGTSAADYMIHDASFNFNVRVDQDRRLSKVFCRLRRDGGITFENRYTSVSKICMYIANLRHGPKTGGGLADETDSTAAARSVCIMSRNRRNVA